MKKGVILVLALALLLGGAGFLYGRLSGRVETEQLGTQEQESRVAAPDFLVYDGEEGEVQLSDFFGKPIVLNFWASWCGPCKMEMPDFEEKYLEIGDDVQFMMVNMTMDGETQETAQAFIDAEGFTFPVFFDLDSDAAYTYGVSSIPATYFIDAEGCVVAQAVGAIDAETLRQGIDLIWNE